jgi:hypothetical protein
MHHASLKGVHWNGKFALLGCCIVSELSKKLITACLMITRDDCEALQSCNEDPLYWSGENDHEMMLRSYVTASHQP